MGAPHSRPERRKRGEIETLQSGSLRVKVYAGNDPLSGRRYYLSETIPAGPQAAAEAEKARTRLLNQVDEQRNPRTKATVNQLLDRYLDVLDVDVTTRKSYEGYIRNHVRPLLGKLSVGKLTGETLDSFYSVLRRCRAHCDGRPFVEHVRSDPHDCAGKCKPHKCRPLVASSIRQVHFCLSGALKERAGQMRGALGAASVASRSEPARRAALRAAPARPARAPVVGDKKTVVGDTVVAGLVGAARAAP